MMCDLILDPMSGRGEIHQNCQDGCHFGCLLLPCYRGSGKEFLVVINGMKFRAFRATCDS